MPEKRKSFAAPAGKQDLAEPAVATSTNAVYLTKEKSPEQLSHWKSYLERVASATCGGDIISATLQYEVKDPGQAAFAFNRAKRVLERVGLLSDEKWRNIKYKSLKALKAEFFSIIYSIDIAHLELLKNAVTSPTTSKGKLRVLYGELTPQTASSADGNDPKATSTVNPVTNKSDIASTVSNVAISSQTLPAPLEGQLLKKIRSDRLSDAITHPSFRLLTKGQQKNVKSAWVAMLVKNDDL